MSRHPALSVLMDFIFYFIKCFIIALLLTALVIYCYILAHHELHHQLIELFDRLRILYQVLAGTIQAVLLLGHFSPEIDPLLFQ